MARKWLTVKLADGSKRIENLDDDGNVTMTFPQPTEIVEVIVSDKPESDLAAAFSAAIDPESDS